jgi:hypothetical protein
VSPPDGLARLGLLARGFVYAVVGVLALQVALGKGGKTVTQQGALKTVAQGGFGKVLLVLLAIGLAGYALWRLSSAWTGRGGKEAKDRVSALVSGIAYGTLCFTAIKLLVGAGASGKSGAKKTTGGVLDWPAGRELVGLVGLIIIGEGVAQLVKGVKRSFLEKSRTDEMSETTERAFTVVGAVGSCARGVVFGLIGVFLIKAAIEYDPKEAIALDGALAKVAHATAGPFLLAVVALGFLAFALYCVADARYRDLDR